MSSNSNITEVFWTLGDFDAVKRQGTADALLTKLSEIEDSSESKKDFDYALKRLISGLCSSNVASRQGYASALTELLREYPEKVETQEVFNSIREKTHVTNSMSGMDLRDLLFGRLVGYAVLERSGRLEGVDKLDGEEKQILTEIMSQIVEDCCAISDKRKWLAELCNEVVCSIIELTKPKGSVFTALLNRIPAFAHVELSEFSPHELALCLHLQRQSKHDLKRLKPLSKLLKKPLLRAKHLADLKEPLLAACRTFPRLHTIWVVIILELQSEPSLLEELWNTVIEESFTSSTPERKCTSFHLFLEITRMLCATGNPELVPRFLTPGFLRCLVNQSSKKSNNLHTQAKVTLKKLAQCLTNWDPNFGAGYDGILQVVIDEADLALRFERARIGAVHALLTNGDRQFDVRTKTNTVLTLLSRAGDSFDLHLASLRDQIVAPGDDGAEGAQMWAINELYAAAKVNRDDQSDAAKLQVALTLMTLAFFKPSSDDDKSSKKSKASELYQVNTKDLLRLAEVGSKLSEKLRTRCETLFFSVLAEYFFPKGNKTATSGAAGAKGEKTSAEDNTPAKKALVRARLIVERCNKILSMWSGLETFGLTLRNEKSEEEIVAIETAVKLCKPEESADEQAALVSVKVLLVNIVLQSLHTDTSEVIEVVELVEDLKQCFERLSSQEQSEDTETPSKKKKGKKTKKQAPVQDENEEDVVTVLVDIMLSLVSRPSAMLREVANSAFKLLCGRMTPNALDALVTVLVSRSTVRQGGDQTDGSDDEDEALMELEEQEESSSDEEENENKESGSKKAMEVEDESSSDEDEIEGDIDPEAAKLLGADGMKDIKQALLDNAPESEQEDEDMDKYDNALAAYLRARTEARKKKSKSHAVQLTKQKVQFKLRVLDFLDIFLQFAPTNPLLVILPVPLQQASARCLKQGGVFIGEDAVGLFNRLLEFQLKLLRKNKVNIATRAIILDQSLTIAAPFINMSSGDITDANDDVPPGHIKVSVGDQLRLIIERSIGSASSAGNKDMLKICDAGVAFVLRMVSKMVAERRHVSVFDEVCETLETCYGTALEKWLYSKNKLNLSYFTDAFQKHAKFAWKMVPKLCEICVEPEGTCTENGKITSAFQRCEALQLLESALKFPPEQGGASGENRNETKLKSMSKFLRALESTLQVAQADAEASAKVGATSGDELNVKVGLMKPARFKQIFSCGTKFVSHMHKALTAKEAGPELLSSEEIVDLIAAIDSMQSALKFVESGEFAPKIQSMATQISSISTQAKEILVKAQDKVEDAPKTPSKASKTDSKSAAAATTGKKKKKRKSNADDDVEAEEEPVSSKKVKKTESKRKRRKSVA